MQEIIVILTSDCGFIGHLEIPQGGEFGETLRSTCVGALYDLTM